MFRTPGVRWRRPLYSGALSLLVGLSACGGRPLASSSAPGAAPWPALQVEIESFVIPSEARVTLVPPDVSRAYDEILSTPLLRDPTFVAEVQRWVDYWSGAAAPWFPRYLERMSWYVTGVDSVLSAGGLPGSLRYLPVIESGYNPGAVSPASAAGIWQFMPATARGLGVRVGPLIDERRSPERSTDAAVRFLTVLREDFGSWALALAAYNGGPNRLRRVLDRYAPLAPRSDSTFWAVRGHLPRETQEFLPKLFGAITVARSPAAFGYEPRAAAPLLFDEVLVTDATTLDVIARAAEVPQPDIVRLNPELLRGMTPPGLAVPVRVPLGQGSVFEVNYPRIPPEERVTFLEHRVAAGETLSLIAVLYGVRVSELEAANPDVRPRYLRIGMRIVVPVASSTRRTAGAGG